MRFETKAMEKNPVFRTARWALSMMKNKIVMTVMMLFTGILFLIAPNGNMNGTVIAVAAVVIIAALINIGIHIIPEDRSRIDIFLAVVNAVLVGFAIYCLFCPSTLEPVVRYIVAIMTIVMNALSLVEVFKLEKKKSWRFSFGLIAALVMMALGVVMILADEAVIATMQRSIGGFLVINSGINIWYIIRLRIEADKAKKEALERSHRRLEKKRNIQE